MEGATLNDFFSFEEICLHPMQHLTGQPIFLSAKPQVDYIPLVCLPPTNSHNPDTLLPLGWAVDDRKYSLRSD